MKLIRIKPEAMKVQYNKKILHALVVKSILQTDNDVLSVGYYEI